MSKEAMKLALEALENAEYGDYDKKELNEAITALQEALAAQPAQRTWVGLTRMDLIKCGALPFGMSYELYQAIEAKLKEKNT